MDGRLDDRVVVVTGATGIARSTALGVAARGGSVFVVSLSEDECVALVHELEDLSGRHAWFAADLTDERATEAAFADLDRTMGSPDALVCVAGGSGRRFGDGSIDTITKQAWDATLDLNLGTTFLAMRETIRRMTTAGAGGAIVVVSSVLATSPSPERFRTHAYASAKGAQLALVRSTAAAYAAEGIRINAIAPGLVATPMSLRAQSDDEILAFARAKQPLSDGILDPSAIAAAAVFLVSDEAATITGQVLAVDGGWSVSEGRP